MAIFIRLLGLRKSSRVEFPGRHATGDSRRHCSSGRVYVLTLTGNSGLRGGVDTANEVLTQL
eukprot:2115812-Prymnesium_polylepis.1